MHPKGYSPETRAGSAAAPEPAEKKPIKAMDKADPDFFIHYEYDPVTKSYDPDKPFGPDGKPIPLINE